MTAIVFLASTLAGLALPGCVAGAADGADEDADDDVAAASQDAEFVFPRLFAGGVSGVGALAHAENSTRFRANGGGVYLHHTGWAPLSDATKDAIVSTWRGKEVAVELGFGGAEGWRDAFMSNYYNRGIRPAFISVNAYDRNQLPTREAWSHYISVFRAAGVDRDTLIVPTFEYANFGPNVATLPRNKVSSRRDFQQLIELSNGINIDSPPAFFFAREQAYRDWVVDAIQWARGHGFMSSVIVSPHDSRGNYDRDAERFVRYLRDHGALPSVINVENYSVERPESYPNAVGSEDNPDQQIGCALRLQTSVLPGLVGRDRDRDGDGKVTESGSRVDTFSGDMRFEFNTNGDREKWTHAAHVSGLTVRDGVMQGRTTSADPNVWIADDGLFFDGGAVRYLRVRLRAGAAGSVQVYWATDHGGFTASNTMSAAYTTPGQWQTVTIPMHEHAGWANRNITAIRVDPISVANTSFQIDWIHTSRRASAR